ncbi:MAG: hypothetical protein K9K67_07590 [Bacteriovoracaceae bacterium]|nr:hypothetical protein [Bacteriovoracaceae bacterium]
MNKLSLLILPLMILFVSCSSATNVGGMKNYEVKMSLEDKSGKFLVVREGGMAKNSKNVVSKYRVYSIDGVGQKVLEQSIAFSTPGILKKSVRLLRPEKSQYKVWFDGQLYQTETSLDRNSKSLVIEMKSPEKQWNGKKSFPFPGGNGVFCYFTQLVECIKYTGFIEKAIKSKAGKMNFHIIWDGYPYIQEQYLNLENDPFAAAVLEYDGQTNEKDFRFSLSISGSVIFYLFNESYDYAKIFWPAQGYSLYHR